MKRINNSHLSLVIGVSDFGFRASDFLAFIALIACEYFPHFIAKIASEYSCNLQLVTSYTNGGIHEFQECNHRNLISSADNLLLQTN